MLVPGGGTSFGNLNVDQIEVCSEATAATIKPHPVTRRSALSSSRGRYFRWDEVNFSECLLECVQKYQQATVSMPQCLLRCYTEVDK